MSPTDCLLDCFRRNPENPVFVAARHRHLDIVWLLLDYGADVNCQDSWFQTPLSWACRFNRLELAVGLIQRYDANKLISDDRGLFAIHLACWNSENCILEEMFNNGHFDETDLLQTDYEGNTPLHTAAMRDNCDAVDLIVKVSAKHGINVNKKNNYGKTPFDVAKKLAKDHLLPHL